MTKRDELLALAERAEAAEGADREIDAAVSLARGLTSRERRAFEDYNAMRPRGAPNYDLAEWLSRDCPAYTASLDAAMTLIPKGMGWQVASREGFDAYVWECWDYGRGWEVEAPTPALALTAAALRARASMEGEG